MDIKEIDKNFARKKVDENGMVSYSVPDPHFDLYGVVFDGEKFVRMPTEIANEVNDGVAYLHKNTAGGRLRFSTDSTKIGIDVSYGWLCKMPHISLSGSAGLVLIDETDEQKPRLAGGFYPEHTFETGFSMCNTVSDGSAMRDYILYLPLYNDVTSLCVKLDAGAKVKGGKKYKNVKPVLYYGSSITQGGCAARPDTSYQAIISKWSNTDYINLGFSGNGCGEKIMADYLAGIDCGVFVCDYDYNAPTPEHLKATHAALFETFRKTHPTTPVVFVSRPNPDFDPEAKRRLEIITETYENAAARGDKNVRLIKGYDLFGDEDRILCTVDGVHPTDLGFYRMAKKIYSVIKEFL